MTHPSHPLDMNSVNAWVAFFQFGWGLILSPIGFVIQQDSLPNSAATRSHGVGVAAGADSDSLHAILDNFRDGFRCGIMVCFRFRFLFPEKKGGKSIYPSTQVLYY